MINKEEKLSAKVRKLAEKTREKMDIKRFFSCKKQLVFYSEASGYYKYYRYFIDYILVNSDIIIHYLTNDADDQVFKITHPNFRVYYCGSNKLIALMMKMDADIVIMTMPDLQRYHIKRSLVKKDIEYIHVPHGMYSFHLILRKGALDYFDTIFCYGKTHNEEIKAQEKVYSLPAKKLVNVGFGLLDMLVEQYNSLEKVKNEKPQILIAPSWQKDNIFEYCFDGLMQGVLSDKYKIIIRPHPEFVKRYPRKMKSIFDKYGDRLGDDFEIQTDFSSNSTVYLSDLVITDWSSIAQEFSFTTKKPSLFINTPMKVMNPEWQKIGVEPMDIWIRDKIGISIDTGKLDGIDKTICTLLDNRKEYEEKICSLLDKYMYNMGNTAKIGGEYIINQLRKKKNNEN